MITSHFFRVLGIFLAMIALGLVGVFLVNNFGQQPEQTTENIGVEVPAGIEE